MKIVTTIAVATLLLAAASVTGIVGFRYPHVLEDEPLRDSIKVFRIEGNEIHLADSRVVVVGTAVEDELRGAVAESELFVDVEVDRAFATVYARQDGWVCGTPWAQPIRIPVFRDTVYRNRRQVIAFGEIRRR